MINILVGGVTAALGTIAGKLITGPIIYQVVKKVLVFSLKKISKSTKNTLDDEICKTVEEALK